MASISFNHQTVRDLMNMVDDHQENVSENQYIEMCNAMKFLHNSNNSLYLINKFINTKLNELTDQKTKVIDELNKISRPRLNLYHKAKAHFNIAYKSKLIKETLKVFIVPQFNQEKPIEKVIIYPVYHLEDIRLQFVDKTCLNAKYIKNTYEVLLKYITSKRIKQEYQNVQYEEQIKQRDLYYIKHFKPLLKETDDLIELRNSIV